MKVKLIWATPEGEQLLAYMARVSNPDNQDNPEYSKILKYMVTNDHWSPFEMVNACVEIETTRDIARQILRHRSFSFQEFSQRYADVSALPAAELRETRLQDHKNRQNSLETDDKDLAAAWASMQGHIAREARYVYKWALEQGVAKEVARAVLPEGLTPSRMYMNGTLRSWLHYCKLRTHESTQKEHREIALAISDLLAEAFPVSWAALK